MSETYSTEGPQCPGCHTQITADEPHYYDDMKYTEDQCDECGARFTVSVYTRTSWTCELIPAPPEGGE